jgi:hypothetical protein
VRAIRTTTISIVALGLLAGSAAGVAAQDESRFSQGLVRILNFTDFGEKSVPEDGRNLEELRGQTYEGIIEASDPRLEGTLTGTLNQDSHLMTPDMVQPLLTQWGTERIENDGGSWECTWSGGEMSFMKVEIMKWCVGEGGYAGYATQMLLTKEGDVGQNWVGLTWEGDLPSWPGPPGSSPE